MGRKPTVLLVESSVQEVDVERRRILADQFHFIQYDCSSVAEFITRLQPGGAYSSIDAIIRTGWLKAGAFADQRLFATDVVAHFPRTLRLICCSGHGYDAADIDAITGKGIWYCNTPNACTEAVANTGLALVLDTFRYLTYAQWCARYDWQRSRVLGLRAVDPSGRALGIVGMGDIGEQIAIKCEAALGMQIHYYGPRRKTETEKKLRHGAIYHATLEEMLPVVDCVVLAAPYTEQTHHLLSYKEFALAKPTGLRVVNIARGPMIDENALVDALEEGKVVGVGLDVHEREPVLHEKLRENWMVTLLPHIAVCSRTSWANFEAQCWDNLEAFFASGKPATPVNTVST